MTFFRTLTKLKKFGQHVRINKREVSTIFALSSGFGKCGVAVIRVSGSNASIALKQLGGFKVLPIPRKAILRRIKNPFTNDILDQGLVLWFPGPRSFTGEDCCELHVHGGAAVISAILSTLGRLPDFRLAEPGEFTKRAFYAGKLDLTAVEGLHDLINSETEFQRQQALLQMEGSLFQVYTEWKKTLIKCVSDIEAYIDFGEDQNIEGNLLEITRGAVTELRNTIKKHLVDGRRGERLRSGVYVTILGAPNVGKSSLLNMLCRRPASIVSPLAGTTRDLIRTDLDLGGYPVMVTDTAGIRTDATDQVEMEGVFRARKAASEADLILLVLDSTHFVQWLLNRTKIVSFELKKNFPTFLTDYIKSLKLKNELKESNDFLNISSQITMNSDFNVLIIFNKVDLLHEPIMNSFCELIKEFGVTFSCKTEFGLNVLLEKLISCVSSLCGKPSEDSPCYNQIRHKLCLQECLSSLDSFLCHEDEQADLAGHHLRIALFSLGKITGHTSTEQILDEIFKGFCIGK